MNRRELLQATLGLVAGAVVPKVPVVDAAKNTWRVENISRPETIVHSGGFTLHVTYLNRSEGRVVEHSIVHMTADGRLIREVREIPITDMA